MKRVLRIAMMALLVMVLCVGLLAPTAMAVETVSIPVYIYMEGDTLPASDTVSATIQPVTEGAPMPADPTLVIHCTGEETIEYINISYTKLGVYEYTVTISGGDYYLAEYGDDEVFKLTVFVVNNENMDGYVVRYQIDGKTEKMDKISDRNLYLDPAKLTVVKKWVDQDSSRPSSIQVDLLFDGEIVQGKTLTLRADSKEPWQGYWDDLDPRLLDHYSVQETNVPAGYKPSYQFNEKTKVWTITNTGSLLQTGQLNWPIPVLCAGGFLMLALGLVMMFRKKEENDA